MTVQSIETCAPRRHITQGQFATGKAGSGLITTILGSCIATCLHDPAARCGGMNHFLLPDGLGASTQAASFGINAMELLINDLIKLGAQRNRLQAKIFGGARMIAGLSDVGAKNAVFVRDFLRREGIACIGESLGGTSARRVEFWPDSGRARQKMLGENVVPDRAVPPPPPPTVDVELF